MATKWGVLSAGKISHDFVTAVRSIPGNDHEFVAVAARNLASAKEFSAMHGIKRAYGSYEDLARDPDIEVVYIGTISSHHFQTGKLMLENKKHVLIEKPMTLSSQQTKALIQLAKKQKCFLMEAIWSRFMPSYTHLMELLRNKAVGDLVHVNACFGVPLIQRDPSRLKKSQGLGSATLDIGIYTLNAVNLVYGGEKPKKIAAVGHLSEEGVDIAMTCSMLYGNNRTAQVTASATADLSNDLIITGTAGHIKLPDPMWCATTVEVSGKTLNFPLPDTILPCHHINSSGLRYEAMEVRKCIKAGKLESSIMPLRDSETLAEIADEIFRQIGVTHENDEED